MSESSSFMKERNDAFNNEVHPGPKHEKAFITVDDSRGIAFEATQGMTREDLQRKNEQAVDDLFKQEEIGSVFEKPQYPDLKDGLTEVKGIDQKVLDSLKDQVDKLDNNKKEAELKNRDEATMSGPKGYGSSLDMLK